MTIIQKIQDIKEPYIIHEIDGNTYISEYETEEQLKGNEQLVLAIETFNIPENEVTLLLFSYDEPLYMENDKVMLKDIMGEPHEITILKNKKYNLNLHVTELVAEYNIILDRTNYSFDATEYRWESSPRDIEHRINLLKDNYKNDANLLGYGVDLINETSILSISSITADDNVTDAIESLKPSNFENITCIAPDLTLQDMYLGDVYIGRIGGLAFMAIYNDGGILTLFNSKVEIEKFKNVTGPRLDW